MANNNAKEPLFQSKIKDQDLEFDLPDEDVLESWNRVIIIGILKGILLFFITLILLALFDYMLLPGVFNVFDLILGLEATLLFFLAFTSMWFGPSHSWAKFKSRFIMGPVSIQTTSVTMRIGMKRIVSGFILIFLVV
jgi:hypothetical protein